MANDSKKYISLTRLSNFLDNIKSMYSQIGHKHTTADLTDYTIDTSLSPTSNNPVANSTIDAEFESVATAMNALEEAIDEKANAIHDHTISEVTDLQVALDKKADVNHAHNDTYYTKTEIDSMEFITVDDVTMQDEVYVQSEEPVDAPNGSIWVDIDEISGGTLLSGSVPSVTTADNEKMLQVVNGEYALVTVENSSIKTYIDNYINEALGGEY
jgi:hypothetical protein